ncbi:MAG TPA: SCO family protein [Vicinamibacterales bacterium]|nr:SCO family protein [Vicinamibacterales bacterium]
MKFQYARSIVVALGVLACVSAVPRPAQAQADQRGASLWAGGATNKAGVPATSSTQILKQVGFDQRLNHQVPLNLTFRDATGRQVTLGQYFGKRPVVLALVYFNCPMLCTQVMDGTVAALKSMTLQAGKDYNFVVVSFDPRDTPKLAAEKQAYYIKDYGTHGDGADGFHFLTGQEPEIQALTKAVGFRYVWDPTVGQFAHPTGIVVITPQGRVARYLFGIDFSPRDLRFALVQASNGKIGTPVDELLLYCYHYDPLTGKYDVLTMRLLRVAGVLTVLAMGSFIFIMWRMEKRGTHRAIPPAAGSAVSGRKA